MEKISNKELLLKQVAEKAPSSIVPILSEVIESFYAELDALKSKPSKQDK